VGEVRAGKNETKLFFRGEMEKTPEKAKRTVKRFEGGVGGKKNVKMARGFNINGGKFVVCISAERGGRVRVCSDRFI